MRSVPLKYVARINERVLDEATDPDFIFCYIDISAVRQGSMTAPATSTRFGDAPSRARRLAKPGDTVISTVRTYLRAVAEVPASSDEPLVFSTGFAVASPDLAAVHPRFLTWQLQGDNFVSMVEAISTGVSYPATTASDLGAIEIKLPSLRRQQAISDFLDGETVKIDALLAKQKTLEAMVLEHRNAKLWRLVTKGNHSNEMSSSGIDWIGEIPGHWQTIRLRDAIVSNVSGTWGSDPLDDGTDIACVRVADFDREAMKVKDPIPTLRNVPTSEFGVREIRRGDLLIERSGGTAVNPVGFVVMYESDTGAVCSNFISRMRISRSSDAKYWLYSLYAARLTRITQKWVKQTTGIQNLDFGGFSTEQFPFPPKTEQLAIARSIDGMMQSVDRELRAIRDLIALLYERRAALITAAVTGQIDVSTYGRAASDAPVTT